MFNAKSHASDLHMILNNLHGHGKSSKSTSKKLSTQIARAARTYKYVVRDWKIEVYQTVILGVYLRYVSMRFIAVWKRNVNENVFIKAPCKPDERDVVDKFYFFMHVYGKNEFSPLTRPFSYNRNGSRAIS
jgi:hypothetical protein